MNHLMTRRVAVITFLSLFPAVAAHAETGAGLEQLLLLSMDDLMSLKVKISTNSEQTLARAPSVVSVITAEDIKATGATNLVDILLSVPGIFVRSNLFGFRPQIFFRGATGPHTLLMINGAPIKDLVWNAGIFWKGLPTSMIERVEIIRGPGSALFGSDASAGVINVITKTAGRIKQSEVGLRTGSFDSQAGWVQHGGNWNGFEIGLTAELSHSNGHNPYIAEDGQTKQDGAVLLTDPTYVPVSYAPGNAHYGWDGADLRFSLAKGNWRLLADYWHHGNVETGLTGGGVLDPVTSGSDNRLNVQLLYNNGVFAQDWGLNAEFRFRDLDYSSGDGFQERPPGFVCTAAKDCNDGTPGPYLDGLINRQRSAERQLNFEASGLYTGIKQHAIRLGGGYSWQDLYFVEHLVNYGTGPDGIALPLNSPLVNLAGSPYAFAPEKPRRISHLYLQDVWTLSNDLELTAGARYDHYSDFGGTLNPRLALIWQNSDRLTSKLMYGEAFRAPSYLELYALTAASIPNPDLTPEQSNTWDLSFTYSVTNNLKLGLDLYQFTQTNLISQDSLKQFQNIGNRTSRGVEIEARWQATKRLRLSGNLTHVEEDDATFPRSLPKNTAHLRADWAFAPNWNWNVQTNWIGNRPLPAGDVRAPLNAYSLVDTTVRYFHRGDWEFAASIRNLFDVDAREYSSASIPNNLPLPGRVFFAELTHRF